MAAAAPVKVKASNRSPASGVAPPPLPVETEAEEGLVILDGSKRIPAGRHQALLQLPERPGFVRRWVNDFPGRVDRYTRGGYEIIKDGTGKPLTTVVSKATGLVAYAMEIPEQFFREDEATKRASLDEVDRAIRGGTFNEQSGDKRYVSKETPIKFSTSSARP